jgi:hypothetical protein
LHSQGRNHTSLKSCLIPVLTFPLLIVRIPTPFVRYSLHFEFISAMTNINDSSSSTTSSMSSASRMDAHSRPTSGRKYSYTHSFCPGQSKPSKTARPSKPDTGAPSHAQKHFDFNRTSPFNSGLDWLLKTTMDVEKRHRHKTSIYGTPLTADSLNAFNCSEQGSEGSSRTHSSATKTSSKGSS